MRPKQSIKTILIALLSLIISGCFPYIGDLYQIPQINGRVILLNELSPIQGVEVQHYGLKNSVVKTDENGEFILEPVAEFGVSVMMMGYVLTNFHVELPPPNALNVDKPAQKALLFPVRANVKLDHFEHAQIVILFDPKTAAGEFATVTSEEGVVIDLNHWYQKIENDPLFGRCDKSQAFSIAMLLSNQQKLRYIIKENAENVAKYKPYEDVFSEQLFSFNEGFLYSCRTEAYHELNDWEKSHLSRTWHDHISPVFDNVQ